MIFIITSSHFLVQKVIIMSKDQANKIRRVQMHGAVNMRVDYY